jgi:hypothetical protein
MEGRLFGMAYQRFEALFFEDAVVRMQARVEVSDRGTKLQANEVMPLAEDGTFSRAPGTLLIRDDGARFNDPKVLDWFKDLVPRFPGPDGVQVEVVAPDGASRTYRLPADAYRVDRTSHGLHAELREVFGADSVREL